MAVRDSLEKRFALFYQLYVRDFEQDVPIYRDLCAKLEGPVLEVGCATGRVTARLAEAGHAVLGIDTRREMLELAREAIRPFEPLARISDFDLRHQPLAERFGLALVTLFSFNQLIDIEEQRLFLRHLLRCLEPGGQVALDCFCPVSLVRPEEVGQWREWGRETERGRLTVRDHREMLTPLLERRTQVFRLDDGPETEVTTHRRYVAPTQLETLLDEAGFESIRQVTDYDLGTEREIDPESRPDGPFLILASR